MYGGYYDEGMEASIDLNFDKKMEARAYASMKKHRLIDEDVG